MAVVATVTALSCLSLGSGWENDAGDMPHELFWNCCCLSATFSCCSSFGHGVGCIQRSYVSVSISERVKSTSDIQEILDLLYAFAKDQLQSRGLNIC